MAKWQRSNATFPPPPIFCPIKSDLGIWSHCFTVIFMISKTRQIGPFFGIFNELLSTQYVKLASLAMVNETFSVIFKHRDLLT